ncbi:transcriptional regulator [Rhizobium rhizosphaerae]|uniref:Transcriptional regulator n=1 Tax=Xaviernesmea rhizosphaerae TaxID=1672749 RepID=A0A1Q9ADZ3_9HYPH|nr:FCD domain-containing protein [Xaviernesmea rhizosphaerae]OLP53097.1 transcriptional regulator [Xaviernesmea rhizosphaerae]OQP87339.1 transcriptional regulator [Xaviernesmea rhizosphaerae]
MTEQEVKASAVDEMVGQIRALIRARGLGVGDVLPSEAELADMFSASRNTVREAFRTLKAYGIAQSRQKLGAVLTDQHQSAMRDLLAFALDISADAFHDIQGYRRLTEMNLFDLLMDHLTDADLAAMSNTNAALLAAGDAEDASARDFDFHLLLVTAAGNRTLTQTYGMLKPVIQRLMLSGKSERETLATVFAEHEAILEALRRRDRIAFTYHMDRHLRAGLVFIEAKAAGGKPPRP